MTQRVYSITLQMVRDRIKLALVPEFPNEPEQADSVHRQLKRDRTKDHQLAFLRCSDSKRLDGTYYIFVSSLCCHLTGGKFETFQLRVLSKSDCVRKNAASVSVAAHASTRVRTCGLQEVLQTGPKR